MSAIALLAAPAAVLLNSSPNTSAPAEVSVTPTLQDIVLANGVTVFGGDPAIIIIVNKFLTLWQEGGFTNVPENK